MALENAVLMHEYVVFNTCEWEQQEFNETNRQNTASRKQ